MPRRWNEFLLARFPDVGEDENNSHAFAGTLLVMKRSLLKSGPKSRSGKPLSPSAAKLQLLKKLRCTLRYENKAWDTGAKMVAGVDEVGRGSLFGCVVAAAVILDPAYRVRGLRDSKLLEPERREVLAERIREHAIAWSVAAVDAARIDQINIYQASRVAMRGAVLRLAPAADHLLIDALRIDCDLPQMAIIHGDALSASIAAASILAKVERDRIMCEWDAVFPAYGLASHKGYSTPRHIAALREFGPTPLHRQSFAPVWQNPIPQEAFMFMDEPIVEAADIEEVLAEDLAG
ncbi:MAG TPA: ribonuclease HII [Candidatus Sulfotelmatobacter sp.]|nr:ribonuclease HII [Candidatus Sulfotelmatobacter sp.]